MKERIILSLVTIFMFTINYCQYDLSEYEERKNGSNYNSGDVLEPIDFSSSFEIFADAYSNGGGAGGSAQAKIELVNDGSTQAIASAYDQDGGTWDYAEDSYSGWIDDLYWRITLHTSSGVTSWGSVHAKW